MFKGNYTGLAKCTAYAARESSIYENFKTYSKYGTVPCRYNRNSRNEVPQNSFYKSVDYINSVVRPIQSVISSLIGQITHLSFSIVLAPLCLALAYSTYWPAKLLTKIFDLKSPYNESKSLTKSLVDYSSILRSKAYDYVTRQFIDFFTAAFNYACAAIVWAAALVITPLMWAVDKIIDKVQSKFSDVEEPEAYTSRSY
ncbi:hypothetical protein [Wolbachia endosymbiont of Folsomia candida]|uniref:hypothetical protein n=1 Tax=Wolbachia endosymbiont of Folsomia candida TaxID=169402 RepID=UPI000ACC3FC1|nr:hypothetical protein [Wolbachia endosymbiont of Folsomia candida]APR98122.1 hypothetical protein ASM33_02300 [Wolbachia endosymbiont of Folsomia candida]